MSPLMLFLVKLAAASKAMADATGTYENSAQKGIEKELALWFRNNTLEIVGLVDKSDTPNNEEIRLGEYEGKIPAVKAYRERTGKNLLDSKNALENHFERYHITFKGY